MSENSVTTPGRYGPMAYRCPERVSGRDRTPDKEAEVSVGRQDEPTYYPPHAIPSLAGPPICSICGAVVGQRDAEMALHTAWHKDQR